MKTILLAGALALTGLTVAGTAAADCETGNLGLFDYDYYGVCVLDGQTYSYPPYYEYTYNTPVSTYIYGYSPDAFFYNNAGVSQYEGEQCWGSCYTFGGSNVYAYNAVYNPTAGYADAGAGLYQGTYDGPGFSYANSGVSGGASAAGQYAYVQYYQYSYNGQCFEGAYVYSSVAGFVELIPQQVCNVEAPLVPALPQA